MSLGGIVIDAEIAKSLELEFIKFARCSQRGLKFTPVKDL
jgi:hypothetical protein